MDAHTWPLLEEGKCIWSHCIHDNRNRGVYHYKQVLAQTLWDSSNRSNLGIGIDRIRDCNLRNHSAKGRNHKEVLGRIAHIKGLVLKGADLVER